MKKKKAIKIAAATAMAASSFAAVGPVSTQAATKAPSVKGYTVVNAKTVKFKFSNGTTSTIKLSRPLKDGADRITFWKYNYHYSVAVKYSYPKVSRITVKDNYHFDVTFNTGAKTTVTMKYRALHQGEDTVKFTYNYKQYTVIMYNGPAPKVTAVNANQVKVEFENGNTTFKPASLKEGENTVKFVYYYHEYTATVNYQAPDTVAPVLNYTGESTINVENGADFTVPTVTATDNKDQNVQVTYKIKDAAGNALDSIDTSKAGEYTVTYSAKDAAGNAAENLVINVVVKEAPVADTTAPVITIDGHQDGDTIKVDNGASFTIPTATATDDKDGSVNVTTTDEAGNPLNSIDTTTAGTYTVIYTATDAAGNTANAKVFVEVAEAAKAPEAPVVTGVTDGQAAKTVTPDVTKVDGVNYTAVLEKDGVAVDGYTLGTEVKDEGSYKLTVTAEKDGLTAQTVVNFIVDATAPVITVDGYKDGDTIQVPNGGTLTIPTATVKDGDKSEAVTPEIQDAAGNVVAQIDSTKEGNYKLVYKATDAAGNAAADVTVNVVVAPALPAVSSVSAINKTDVTVTLASAPATDLTKDDASKFEVKVGSDVVPVTDVTKVTSDSTGKTYKLAVALDKKEGTVTVNDKESAAFDFKAPEIASITPVSSKVFDIKFSEKVNAGLAQLIGNYAMVETGTANVVTLSGNATAKVTGDDTVRITLNSSLTEGKSYTVTASGMQDVSANKNTSTSSSSSFTAIKDAVKPTLVSAKALDSNRVELTFSEELKSVSDASVTAVVKKYNADGTLGNSIANTVTNGTDNNKLIVTVTNSDDYFKNGDKLNVEVSGGSDVEGNAIDANQKTDFTGLRDDVAPTVTSSFADNKLTLKFSEAMNTDNLTTKADDKYYVFNALTGDPVSSSNYTITKNTDNNEVYITFTSGLTSGETYSVRINNQKDNSITPNPLKANTIVQFTAPVVTTPVTLASVDETSDGKSVNLTLAGSVNAAEAENINNYKIVDASDATKVLDVTKAVYNSSTKVVTLTTAAQTEGSNNYKVTISNFTNLGTNADSLSGTFDGIDTTKPVLQSVNVLGLSAVDLVFSEDLNATQNAPEKVIKVVEKGTANVVATTESTISKNKFRINFDSPLTAGKEYTISVTGIKDKAATPNLSETTNLNFTAQADTTAPTISKIEAINAATINVYFNEEVAQAGALDASNFVIKKGDQVVNWDNLDVNFSSDDPTKVTLKNVDSSDNLKALFEDGASYTLTVKDNGNNFVKDVSNNKVTEATYSFTGKKDIVKPTLVSAKMASDSDNKVVLTFSEPLASAGEATDYIVTNATTGEQNTVLDGSVDPDNAPVLGTGDKANQVTLTLNDKTVVGQQYRVYVKNNSGEIEDLAVTPNVLDSTKAIALFDGVDRTAPTAPSVKLTGEKTAVLTFDEKLDPSSVSKDDFTVGDNTVTDAKVESDGTDVTLTFGTAVDTGKTDLAVGLVDGQYVTDLAGNKLSSFSVTSDTDAAKPVLKTYNVTSTGAGTSTITLGFSEDLSAINSAADPTILTVPNYTVNNIKTVGKTIVVTVDQDLAGQTPTVDLINSGAAITDGTNAYTGGDIVVATTNQLAIDQAAATSAVNSASTLVDALPQDGTATTSDINNAQTSLTNAKGKVDALPADVSPDTTKATLTAKVTAEQAKITSALKAQQAVSAVVAYEGLGGDLTTDDLIAQAVTDANGLKAAATTAISDATAAGVSSTVTDALTGRVTTHASAIDTAATVATVAVSDVNLGAGANTNVQVTAVAKNAAGVTLSTALTGNYAVTYSWSVTSASDAASPTAHTAAAGDLTFSDTTASPTITKAVAGDVGDSYGIEAVVTQGAKAPVNGTATVTLN